MTAEHLRQHEKSGARRPTGPKPTLRVPQMEQSAASRSRRGSSRVTSPSLRQTGQRPGCGPRGRGRGHLRVYGRDRVFPRVGKHGPFHVGVLHLHHKAPGDPRALLNPGARLEVLILPGRKGESGGAAVTSHHRPRGAAQPRRMHGASRHPSDSHAGEDWCHPASRENRQRAGVTTRAQAH